MKFLLTTATFLSLLSLFPLIIDASSSTGPRVGSSHNNKGAKDSNKLSIDDNSIPERNPQRSLKGTSKSKSSSKDSKDSSRSDEDDVNHCGFVEISSTDCNKAIMEDSILVEDMICDCDQRPALTIAKDGVSIDTNGHTIGCVDGSFGNGKLKPTPGGRNIFNPCVYIEDVSFVTIYGGGSISNCYHGIAMTNSNLNEIHDIHIGTCDRNGIQKDNANNNFIHDVVIEDAKSGVVLYTGEGNKIHNSIITNIQDSAVVLNYGRSNQIIGNEISGIGSFGVSIVESSYSTISMNTIKNCESGAIIVYEQEAEFNLISENSIQDIDGHGVFINYNSKDDRGPEMNRIEKNTVQSVTSSCYKIEGDNNFLKDNYCENAGNDGFQIFHASENGENIVKMNTAKGSDGNGFVVGSLFFYSSAYTDFICNKAEENALHGFLLYDDFNMLVKANEAKKNGGNGFYIDADVYSHPSIDKSDILEAKKNRGEGFSIGTDNFYFIDMIDNISYKNNVDGFRIEGTFITFSGDNLSKKNDGNGYSITSTAPLVTFSNEGGSLAVADDNDGYGFWNHKNSDVYFEDGVDGSTAAMGNEEGDYLLDAEDRLIIS